MSDGVGPSRATAPLGLLAAFVAATAATAGLAFRSWPAALLGVPALLALVLAVRLPAAVARGLAWIARGAAGATAALAFVSTLYPVIPEHVIAAASSAGGHLLVLVAVVLLLGRAHPPGGGLVVAGLGALVAAALPPEPDHFRIAGGLAALSLVAWLLLHDDEEPFGAASARPAWPSAAFLVLAALVAGGVAWSLPIAQPRVEQAVAEMMAGSGEATTGLATESRLGDVERLARSPRLALRVYADEPRDLRVRAFTRLDGRTWRADARPGLRLAPASIPAGRWPRLDSTPGQDLARPAVRLDGSLAAVRIVSRFPERGAMPAPAHALAVRLEGTGTVLQDASGVLRPEGAPALYAVLAAADDPAGAAPGAEALELPRGLDPRLRALAAELGPPDASADEKVRRTVGFFHRDFRYSLDVGRFRSGDPVAEFVFEKKKGYCEYFATATTLLLRLQGVPARYVTGYAVRPFQRSGTHFLVRDSDAHAWAEAWVPGRGFVEADATPPADYEALHGDLRPGALDALQASWDALVARWSQGGLVGLARALGAAAADHPGALAAVALALLGWRLARRRRPRPATAPKAGPVALLPPPLKSLLGSVDALCAARGARRPAARAPREHVSRHEVALSGSERAACLAAVELLYAAAYGGVAADPERVAEAARVLDHLRRTPGSDRPAG